MGKTGLLTECSEWGLRGTNASYLILWILFILSKLNSVFLKDFKPGVVYSFTNQHK
jgi:hypothetical protein